MAFHGGMKELCLKLDLSPNPNGVSGLQLAV
jgi:hypothetical protein